MIIFVSTLSQFALEEGSIYCIGNLKDISKTYCTTMAARFSAAFIICKHPWQQLLRFQEFYLFLRYELK